MTTIDCRVAGRDYRLDYEVAQITSGRIFQGTIYLDHIIDFYWELPEDGGAGLFSPVNTKKEIKEAVMSAILRNERTP